MHMNTLLCRSTHICKQRHTQSHLRHEASSELGMCPKPQGVFPTVWLIDEGLCEHTQMEVHTLARMCENTAAHTQPPAAAPGEL